MKAISLKACLLACISIFLFSFVLKPGGEGFEVFINNNAVVQQFGKNAGEIKTIQLNPNDNLVIKYYHCGIAGKNRVVTVKNGQNKVLREFRYKDNTQASGGMFISVKDVLDAGKNNSDLKLCYSSSELPNGRTLVKLSANSTASMIHP